MALSPNDTTVASGGQDRTVRLWDIGTGKVITKWTGHTDYVMSVCWSVDGKRVLSGSLDETVRVWDVKTSETVMAITTGHLHVWAVIYSPDNANFATGGFKDGFKIWDAKMGELFIKLKHDLTICSLAWISDGKKLISASYGPIRIFETSTWQQIACLGHKHWVYAISLSHNNLLLASAYDQTACLWNLDTNLPVGLPLQHEHLVKCAALSADGQVLVTGCEDGSVCVWDIHTILKEAGLEDLLSIPHFPVQKSLKDSDATGRPPIQACRIPPGFFDSAQFPDTSTLSPVHNPRRLSVHQSLSTNPPRLLESLLSFFHRSHSNADGETELQQRPSRSTFSHGPRIVEVATVQDRKALYVAPRPRPQQQSQSHVQGPSSQSQPTATSSSTIPVQGSSTVTVQSPPVPLWARLILFICCASPPHANGH